MILYSKYNCIYDYLVKQRINLPRSVASRRDVFKCGSKLELKCLLANTLQLGKNLLPAHLASVHRAVAN